MRKATPIAAALMFSAMAGPLSAQQAITTTHAGLESDLAGTLEGTLAQGTPAVLIVPGSGPTDRDGNSPLGIAAPVDVAAKYSPLVPPPPLPPPFLPPPP